MDVIKLIEKIDTTYTRVEAKIENIKNTYNNAASDINDYIKDLEFIINDTKKKLRRGMKNALKWAQKKIDAITEKINKSLEFLEDLLNDLTTDLETYYEEQMLKLKIVSIKAIFAKLGNSITDDNAKEFIESLPIPHPSIETLLPKFEFNIEFPDITRLASLDTGEVELEKLPYI